MKVLLVSGSRKWTDYQAVWSEIGLRSKPVVDLIVHGACGLDCGDFEILRSPNQINGLEKMYGADACAHAAALAFKIPVLPMPANWRMDPKRGGSIRNKHMVRLVKSLVCCGWGAEVITFHLHGGVGTPNLARAARAAGLTVTDCGDPTCA